MKKVAVRLLIFSTLLVATLTSAIAAEKVKSITIAPSTVTGGAYATATVTLVEKAPAGGQMVNLTADAGATVAASTTFAAGTMVKTIQVATAPVSSKLRPRIFAYSDAATYSGGMASFVRLTVNPPAISGFSILPASVNAGATATGYVSLGSTPPEGFAVALQSNSADATPPATITFTGGVRKVSFSIPTGAPTADELVTLTAFYGEYSIVNASLTIIAPSINAFTAGATVRGGSLLSGMVMLKASAPAGGVTVNVGSNNSALAGTSVTIPAGKTTAGFKLTSVAVGTDTPVVLTATLAAQSVTANTTVLAPTVRAVTVAPTSVMSGKPAKGTVYISTPAPVGGFPITLSSDSAAATPAGSVTVAGGATSATFDITTVGVGSSTTANISAAANGVSKSGALTITPAAIAGIMFSPSSVSGGLDANATIRLTGIAPSGGTQVALSSDNAAANPPAIVTIPAGTSQLSFSVPTTAVTANQTATISATLSGQTMTKMLSVKIPHVTALTFDPSSVEGGVVNPTGTVTIGSPAPAGGFVVSLACASNRVSLPTTVTVPEGSTSVTFTVTTFVVATNMSVTITANDGAVTIYSHLGLISLVKLASLDFPTDVNTGDTVTFTLNLNRAAETGGVLIYGFTTNPENIDLAGVKYTIDEGQSTGTFTVQVYATKLTTVYIAFFDDNGGYVEKTITIHP